MYDVIAGAKFKAGNGVTLRVEKNLTNGDVQVKVAGSRGNWEIASGTFVWDGIAFGPDNFHLTDDFAAIKDDIGIRGGIVGGSLTAPIPGVQGMKLGARFGLGLEDFNVYIEVEGEIVSVEDLPAPVQYAIKAYHKGRIAFDDLASEISNAIAGHAGLSHCFLAGTPIDMWPVETVGLEPDADGTFDQAKVLAGIWQKPIEQIKTGDWVVARNQDGLLVPGRAGQTYRNRSKHILDLPVPQFDNSGRPNGLVKSLMR